MNQILLFLMPNDLIKKNILFLFLFVIFKADGFAEGLDSSSQVSSQTESQSLANNSSEPKTIDLPGLIEEAYKNNPKLIAARNRWQAVIEKYPQESSLDDPTLMYSYFSKGIKNTGPQRQELLLSQTFPFPNKLDTKSKIVSKEVEIAKLNFEKESQDIIFELKDAFYELGYLEQAIDISKRNKELVEHLAKIGMADYAPKIDGTTLNDVFKAQSQVAQVSYDLILLTELKEVQITRINSLLNLPPESPLGKPANFEFAPLNYELADLYKLAKENQQELKIMQADMEKNEEMKKLSRLDYYPDFNVGLGYMRMNMNEAEMKLVEREENAFSASIGINIPLWRQKNSARVKEAELNVEAVKNTKKAAENTIVSEIKAIYFKLHNFERLIKLYKESLIPQAAQSIETAESWYKEKRGSFSGLLETQLVWLNFNLAAQRAVTDYYQSLSKLEKIVGRSL